MPLTDISTEAKLFTNHEIVELQPIEGDDGLVEIERTDDDEVAIHFRHYADESAYISAFLTRSQVASLLTVLKAAVE